MSLPNMPLILEPDELELNLDDEKLLIVDLCDQSTFASNHVPGAVHLEYGRIVWARPPAMGLLPDRAHLSEVLTSIGLTPQTHVVAYDDEGNAKACRLLWTLDALGHGTFSLLDGGLHSWLNEGHRTATGLTEPRPGNYVAKIQDGPIADKAYILARLDDPGVAILDARTPGEFGGSDKRAARAGHIPSAVNMDWTLAIDRERNSRLKQAVELQALLEEMGVTRDKRSSRIAKHTTAHPTPTLCSSR